MGSRQLSELRKLQCIQPFKINIEKLINCIISFADETDVLSKNMKRLDEVKDENVKYYDYTSR